MAHFIGLHESASAKDVADTFLQEVWKLHGLRTEIISDMGPKFSGEFWESLCKMLGVKRHKSTAYHPQTDGQTERTNQVLEGYLTNICQLRSKRVVSTIAVSRTCLQQPATNAHKMTPFFANYGFHPQTEWMKETEAHNPGATIYAHWMQDIHRQVKETLENTRESLKKYYDPNATKQPTIEVGDLVMLNAKNIRNEKKKNSTK